MKRFVGLFIIWFVSAQNDKKFRTDYQYNRKVNAFYKLHIEGTLLSKAKKICEMEDAALLVPYSQQDIFQVHGMLKQYPDIGNSVWVGDDGKKHESAEENPIINLSNSISEEDSARWYLYPKSCNVITREGNIDSHRCLENLPFVCKVDAKDVKYDSQCQLYASNYIYMANVSSCYKVPSLPYNWNEAYSECEAEGGHLVVINSEAEREVVQRITQTAASVGADISWFFFAGFRANKPTDGTPREFKTIFNQTLETAGFSEWSEHEPNNSREREYCGCIFKTDGKFNDIDCNEKLAFVCEKEIN